jgi:hypothetical protein
MRFLGGFAASFMIASACAAAEPVIFTGTIAGRITDAHEGITVQFIGPEPEGERHIAVTDREGRFSTSNLPVGSYEVAPLEPGFVFVPTSMRVFIRSFDITSLVFQRMQPDEGLDSETLKRIDALPDTWLSDEEIVLPDGRSLAWHKKGMCSRQEEAIQELNLTPEAAFAMRESCNPSNKSK